jgi:hypothetical protein
VLRFPVFLLLFLAACGPSDPPPAASNDHALDAARLESDARPATARNEARPVPDPVQRLTGAHTRLVWIQDLSDGTDIAGRRRRLLLMGYDSGDGLGERPLLEERSNYTKPLITPTGKRVVFSSTRDGSVYVVNWDGTDLRKLGPGFALDTWIDPETQTEWVYVGSDENTEDGTFGRVTRHPIDRWRASELVWDKLPVSGDTFQVSADGRLAGGLFPWPEAGVVELPNGAFHRLGKGCWTALSNGRDPLLWVFDGAHRNLTLVDVDHRAQRWTFRINDAPGVEGYEVYHPRWSNNPRFLAITGPYTVGTEDNKIRAGGEQVEIYMGRFTADFTDVERWIQVSDNDRADFYPDAWIDPKELPPDEGTRDTARPEARRTTEGGRLIVEARLIESAPIPAPESILPYRHALLANEYEVVKVLEGTYQGDRILAAHWVIRDGKVLDSAVRKEGIVRRMTLELYDQHEELEGERLVMDSDAFDLRLYYDIES